VRVVVAGRAVGGDVASDLVFKLERRMNAMQARALGSDAVSGAQSAAPPVLLIRVLESKTNGLLCASVRLFLLHSRAVSLSRQSRYLTAILRQLIAVRTYKEKQPISTLPFKESKASSR
jgi:hypothetical protein